MKLTICDNSIRLRLVRGEVDELRDAGVVEAAIEFPGGRKLRYGVESTPASVNPAAFFSDNSVLVRLPETLVLAWATTGQVSIRGEQVLDDGGILTILVEKDSVCVEDRESEDEASTSVHAQAPTASC